MTDAPASLKIFRGQGQGEDHVALPAGTVIVSPLRGRDESLTSARAALAATQFGLEPVQAASAR